MLWVGGVDLVTPGQHSNWELGDMGMDGAAVSGIPDDEGVVLTESSQEPIIRTKSQFLNAYLHSFENSYWFLGIEIPQYNGSIR